MKIKTIFLSLLSFAAVTAFGQSIEQDDMYFNAKDRVKLREAKKQNALAMASTRNTRKETDEEVNPTDSYSARNINPEYTSRAQSNTSQADEQDYYVANYRYANQGHYNEFNSNYNNWYNNPWYRSNYWGSSIYGWNSPYYGSAYDTWGNPWANPYYRSGWSSGFSFYYGRSWNYGGFNNCFSCNPYAYYDPYYDFYSPFSYGYNPYWGAPMYYNGYNGWNRPYRVVYVDNDDYRGTYGKRSSRSSQLNRDVDDGSRGNGRVAVEGRDGSRTNTGGRVNTATNRQQEYYNNTWRNTPRENTNSSFTTPTRSATPSWNNTNTSTPTRSSWESQQRSNSSYSPPARSSDASRSSAPSGGSSSSGSRSRGRD
ncbi:MAG TPA: hypothetical protein VGD65_07325 [Chryseosolibacter sp.]